jgi:hypothetical protein
LAPRFRSRSRYVQLFAGKVKAGLATMAQALPEPYRRCRRQFGRNGASQHKVKHRRGDSHKSFSPANKVLFQNALFRPSADHESTGQGMV